MTEESVKSRPGNYGCFLHPRKGFKTTSIDASCDECGRRYSFPLSEHPASIKDYEIQSPLGRGFYGAIYKATHGPLHRPCVLKVIPESVYEFHGKNFDQECRLHHEVSQGTGHLVEITTFFSAEVHFQNDLRVRCHVAVLDYVKGQELDRFLEKQEHRNARTLAQLSIDLFRLLQELEQKKSYHNDLHYGNILVEKLPLSRYRSEAVDETVRLVAVDLGSLTENSLSGPERPALGDLSSVAKFLRQFAEPLLASPDTTVDTDYRLTNVLVELAHQITGTAANLRTPNYADFIDQIKQAYTEASSPWRPPTSLRRFNDAYNAQTLHPCFVPRLLVDPGGEWISAVSSGGPQVITGVRGCGKTMLLRALQFHARLSAHVESSDKNRELAITELVENDGYIGLYISARRLLDALGSTEGPLHEPYARLLVAYAREAVRAGRHFDEVDRAALRIRWWQAIARAVEGSVANTTNTLQAASPQVLERRLQGVLFSLDRGEQKHKLLTNPALAFPALAEAVLGCSDFWERSKVLYLLDDVSTRHLKEQSIADLLGTLLFSDENCAVKITTEGQTLELALKSPGLVERARADRDYEPFDLAARVNEKLKTQDGTAFLAEILRLRASQFNRHPSMSPKDLLGNASLEEIARGIVSSGRTAAERKQTYHGLTALSAVCVGDIGDVLNIYDAILRKERKQPESQILPELQNAAFQEYSSRRLYHLNRRNGELKDFAMSFAQAAYELLMRSARPKDGRSAKRRRLRQYAQLYVRITAGDETFQFEKLRELIDAGVFVLESGSDSPRTKTRDSNPISQFILTYRKLFGLSRQIGLAFSDRFELSGEQLEEWLRNPSDGKSILMKNLGGPLSSAERKPVSMKIQVPPRSAQQLHLPISSSGDWERPNVLLPISGDMEMPLVQDSNSARRMPLARELTRHALRELGTKSLVVGLGFEDRCLESVKRLVADIGNSLEHVTLISYPELGHSERIRKTLSRLDCNIDTVDHAQVTVELAPNLPPGPILVDVTGLAKSMIFLYVRAALLRHRSVVVTHTQAASHYPLDQDIKEVFSASHKINEFEILLRAGKLWSGDRTPYAFKPLLGADLDDSRPLLLCAAASAKHERLLSLMDERDYVAADVIVPSSKSFRSQLAQLAADVATRGIEAPSLHTVDSNNLQNMLTYLSSRFQSFYVNAGFSIELGLTGSKMHAVACAATSAAFKIAQVWYVAPSGFVPERFTQGVGASRYIYLDMQQHQEDQALLPFKPPED